MDVVETQETERGIALFNRRATAKSSGTVSKEALDSVILQVTDAAPGDFSRDAVVTASTFADLPDAVRSQAKAEGYDENGRNAEGQKITGVTYDGKVYLVQGNISSELEAEEALLHERIHQILHDNPEDASQTGLWDSLSRLYGRLLGKEGIIRMAKEMGVDISGPLAALPTVAKRNRAAFLAEEFLSHAEGARAYEKVPAKALRAIKEF